MRRATGYLREIHKGLWRGKVAVGKDASGKPCYQWFTVRGNRKSAEDKVTDIRASINAGTYIRPAKDTLSAYLDSWLADSSPSLSPKTVEGYQHILNHYVKPKLGNLTLTSFTPQHLQHFYSEELQSGLSAMTVRHFAMLLHKSFDDAVRLGMIPRNPADAVSPPKAQKQIMETWGEAEIHHFLESVKDTDYYPVFFLALYSGMRRSELLGLRWCDVDLLYSTISVCQSLHVLKGGKVIIRQPKTASGRRSIALSPSCVLMLTDYRLQKESEGILLGVSLKDTDLVFSSAGKPMLPATVSHAWRKMVRKAGLKPIRLHDSRHSHASMMLKLGVHPKVVSERLGHSSIQITLDVYSHILPGLQEAAAARFDEAMKVGDNTSTRNSVS